MEQVRPGGFPPSQNTSKPDTAKTRKGHRRNRDSIGSPAAFEAIKAAADEDMSRKNI